MDESAPVMVTKVTEGSAVSLILYIFIINLNIIIAAILI